MIIMHNTKRIFTAALVFWMSGIVLLFCCDMPTASAADAEIESCPLARKNACSKTSASDSEHSFKHDPRTFDCCVFPAKIFDKVRKTEKSPEAAAVAETVAIDAPKFSSVDKPSEPSRFYQSFARDRGSTYLQNCVFRI